MKSKPSVVVFTKDVEEFFRSEPPPRRFVRPMVTYSLIFDWKLVFWFVLFGLLMTYSCYAFNPYTVVSDSILNTSAKETKGEVKASYERGLSDEGDSYYQMYFEFKTNEGTFSGTCFDRATSYREGREVTIEYLEEDPRVSRIKTTKRSLGGFLDGWILIFPFIAFLAIIFKITSGLKTAYFVKNGDFKNPNAVGLKAESSDAKTRQKKSDLIMYDPSNINNTLYFDNIRNSVKITDTADVKAKGESSLITRVIIILAVSLSTMFFCYMFLSKHV